VIGRTRHLHEERLIECYVTEQAGEALDPRLADHLAECADCGARYSDLTRFMDDLRAHGDVELDAIFTGDDLRTQRDQIARRIEHLGHVARVLSFPGRLAYQGETSPSRNASRWVAAAAAAGLFVGLGLGAFTDVGARLRADREVNPSPISAPSSPPIQVADPGVPQRAMDDDAFLLELEIAGGRLRTSALMPLDAFTPSVREASAQLR
jgi:hypothetical protein